MPRSCLLICFSCGAPLRCRLRRGSRKSAALLPYPALMHRGKMSVLHAAGATPHSWSRRTDAIRMLVKGKKSNNGTHMPSLTLLLASLPLFAHAPGDRLCHKASGALEVVLCARGGATTSNFSRPCMTATGRDGRTNPLYSNCCYLSPRSIKVASRGPPPPRAVAVVGVRGPAEREKSATETRLFFAIFPPSAAARTAKDGSNENSSARVFRMAKALQHLLSLGANEDDSIRHP